MGNLHNPTADKKKGNNGGLSFQKGKTNDVERAP